MQKGHTRHSLQTRLPPTFNSGMAVPGNAALFKIALVVLLRAVKVPGRQDFSNDGRVPPSELLLLLFGSARCHFLLRRIKKYCRAILRTNIRPLPIQRSWIMAIPEYVEQCLIADTGRIIFDSHHFRMSSLAGTDIMISRGLSNALPNTRIWPLVPPRPHGTQLPRPRSSLLQKSRFLSFNNSF